MPENPHAVVYDVDGVLVGGEPVQPQVHGVAKLIISTAEGLDSAIRRANPRNPNSNDIQKISDRMLLAAVGRISVSPEARDHLAAISEYPIDIYGSTGRPDRQPWVIATRRTLQEGGVLHYFSDIKYKPNGVSAEEGKIMHIRALLKTHQGITVVEDNSAEALAIARAFSGDRVGILLVQSLRSGRSGVLFSKGERDELPNVRRIASLRQVSPQEVLRYAN